MSARRPSVVGLGLCVLDHLYLLDELPGPDERTRYLERRVEVGGMVTNALAQAARLGCRAELISAVGDDDEGRLARRRVRAAGIGTRRLRLSPKLPTTVAVVWVRRRDGERRFLVADRRSFEGRATGFDLTPLRRAAALMIDGHFPVQARRAARLARRHGVPVIGDFSDPRPEYLELLPWVDYPVLPEVFVRRWAPGDPAAALRRLHERYGATPVITQGARGGLYWHGGRAHRFRSPRVRVRDTTGAGDAFHGAFAAGLAQGLELPEVVRRAARAGARACTAFGGFGRGATRREWAARGAFR